MRIPDHASAGRSRQDLRGEVQTPLSPLLAFAAMMAPVASGFCSQSLPLAA